MKIKIKVTKEDIKTGMKTNCVKCPVAQALARSIPDYKFEVGSSNVSVLLTRDWRTEVAFLGLPAKVSKAIIAFDEGKGMKPFSFELDDDQDAP